MKTSLYIHIPFCKTKCDYCDFFSIPCGDASVPDAYIDAAVNEIRFRAEENGVTSWETVYIGGGTPSLLSGVQLRRLMHCVFELHGGRPAEITMEINPDDVTALKLSAIEDAGISRLSCGIQALNGKTLNAVKRRSSEAAAFSALECIKSNWHGIFSADMISALPGQNEENFICGMKELVSYSPDHISLYSLTVEENTPLGKAVAAGALKYDYDEADRMWICGRDFLECAGYKQYEVSNFCRPGKECSHNLVYWRLQDYIGAGAGGTGTVYGRNAVRWTNTKNIEEYIKFWQNPNIAAGKIPAQIELIDEQTQSFEFFMMGLRTAEGICAETYSERFRCEIPEKVKNVFHKWNSRSLCSSYEKDGKHFYALNKKGLLFLNDFLEQII